MARIRTIKPEFWLNEDLSSVSSDACLLAIGLLNIADDEGYFNANEKLITAAIFPLRELSVSVRGLLNELSNIGYLETFFVVGGKKHGCIKNFRVHQVISRPTASKIKGLERINEDSVSNHGVINEDSIGKGKERKGIVSSSEDSVTTDTQHKPANPNKGTRLSKDWTLPEDWKLWAEVTRPDLDPIATAESFKDWWIATPGAKAVKLDWLATWRNWVRNQKPGKPNAFNAKPSADPFEGAI
jgi:hypothetical protein